MRKALVVILVVFVALLAAPFLVDLSRFEPQLQRALGKRLDARVELATARLQLLPRPGLRLGTMRLYNTDFAGADGPVAEVENAELLLSPWALVRGTLEATLKLHGARLHVVGSGGETNLAALAKSGARATPEGEVSGKDSVSLLESLVVTVVTFDAFEVVTAGDLPALRISGLEGELRNIGLDRDMSGHLEARLDARDDALAAKGPLRLEMTARIAEGVGSLKTTFAGRLDLDDVALASGDVLRKAAGLPLAVDFRGNQDEGGLVLPEIVAVLGDSRIRAEAAITDFKSLRARLRGDGQLDAATLAAVLPAHAKLLTGGELRLRFSAAGRLAGARAVQGAAHIASTIPAAKVVADVALRGVAPLSLAVDVKGEMLDLGAIMAAFEGVGAKAGPAGPTPAAKGAKSRTRIAVKARIAEVRLADRSLDDVQVEAEKVGDTLRIDRAALGAFGGTLTGSGRVDTGRSPAAVTFRAGARGVEAGALTGLLLPAAKDALTGSLTVDLAGSFAGLELEALSRSLSATGSFALAEGSLKGAGVLRPLLARVDQALASVRVGTLAKVELAAAVPERDLIGNAKGSVQIEKGRIRVTADDAVGDFGRFVIDGSAGLDLTLDGKGQFIAGPALEKALLARSRQAALLWKDGGSLTVPFSLGGSLLAPALTPDLTPLRATLAANARKRLEKEAGAELEKRLKGLLGH